MIRISCMCVNIGGIYVVDLKVHSSMVGCHILLAYIINRKKVNVAQSYEDRS